jgi:Leucine-rich repeat (LRR) protein
VTSSIRLIWNLNLLGYVSLKEIQPDLFTDLTSLQKLTLRVNELTHLDALTFASLSNLTELDLSFNWLEDIHKNAFQPLVSLRRLNLEMNLLKRFDFSCLAGLTSLEEVILVNNQLKNIDLARLNALGLKNVRLNKNPGFKDVKMVNGSVVIEFSKILASDVDSLRGSCWGVFLTVLVAIDLDV